MYKISSIVGAVIALALTIRTARAQSVVVADTTLGTEASLVNSLDPNLPVDVINGGAIRGNNLFHSFSQFNVGANRGVYFFSPSANIANILARVTGGNINVNASTLSISNNASLNSSSLGEGKAGDININARSVKLDNPGIIAAVTNYGNGGNINLTATDLLLLRHGSFISTTAGIAQAGGNGGNISINTPFIIAVPNEDSDITADAFTGKGGNVNINVQSIIGIEKRANQMPTSDITASSQRGIQGQINITKPEFQPTQGIIELAEKFVDASNQIGQICPKGEYARCHEGKFTITGSGSLPPNPLELLPGTTSLTQLATLDFSLQNVKLPTKDASNSQIIEAQGWVKMNDGSVELVAMAPVVLPSGRPTANPCTGHFN